MIIKIVDKHEWYTALIKADCPERLLKVAWAILDFVDAQEESDRYGWAYPTVDQIRERSGKSSSKISEYTSELAANGWLIKETVSRSSGRKTFYKLVIGNVFETTPRTGNKDNLKQFASPAERKVQLPLNGTSISRRKESASPVVRDDKHKQETSTQTLTKTETKQKIMNVIYIGHSEGAQRATAGSLLLIPIENIPSDAIENLPCISRRKVVGSMPEYSFMRIIDDNI